MAKVSSLRGAARYAKDRRDEGQTVGLIVGSFDILHLGHINLFRFAKKHVDCIIVGLDNDQTIKLVKGKNRPVNNFRRRSEVLTDLETIDKIFLVEKTSFHGSETVSGVSPILPPMPAMRFCPNPTEGVKVTPAKYLSISLPCISEASYYSKNVIPCVPGSNPSTGAQDQSFDRERSRTVLSIWGCLYGSTGTNTVLAA